MEKSTLGPRLMDKLIVDSSNKVTISNDSNGSNITQILKPKIESADEPSTEAPNEQKPANESSNAETAKRTESSNDLVISASNVRAKISLQCRGYNEVMSNLQVYLDRYLCEKVVSGNRVTIIGIYSIKKLSQPSKGDQSRGNTNIGIRAPYLRVIGIKLETEDRGHSGSIPYTNDEEILFQNLARSPNIFERIAKSVAPSIYGYEDMKKAVTCLLFSGSRKRLPDGLTRRGDINVLFLGDPGTAKSQLLKFVEKVAPIGICTSGKGSSAAGLTASVIRDLASRNFVMEGGCMVGGEKC